MRWLCGSKKLEIKRPLIMGIVNVTPDSFSDGGTHASVSEAIAFGEQLLALLKKRSLGSYLLSGCF